MARKTKKPEPITNPQRAEMPGELIASEIDRVVGEEFELNVIRDSHCVHFTIDLDHNCERFEMIAVHSCYGNVAKQIVAECERVAGVYQRLAQSVKERIWQDYLEMASGPSKGGAG